MPNPLPRPPTWSERLRFLLGLGAFAACALVAAGSSVIRRPFVSGENGRQIGRANAAQGFRRFFRAIELLGLIEIDNAELQQLRDAGPMIVAPNHPSMLDVGIILVQLPQLCCVMKAELHRNVLIGPEARLAGYIGNDSPRGLVRDAYEEIQRGGQLLLFPEGTRSVRHPVNELTRGYALIANRCRVPVQTVLIDTDTPYLGKGWSVFRCPVFPMRFTVRLGARFEVSRDPGLLVDRMQAYYEEALADANLHLRTGTETRASVNVDAQIQGELPADQHGRSLG